jgi:predicted peptidase
MKQFLWLPILSLFLYSSCAVKKPQNLSKDLYSYETHIVGADTLKYRMLLPHNFSEDKEYPIVLFLHGAGERGNDNEKQLVHGSSLFLSQRARDSFPAIIIVPQCPENDYWSKLEADRTTRPITFKYKYDEAPTKAMNLTMDLMDKTVSKPYAKTDQVYVMGLSMGGMGTFEIIHRKPELFAAAIPICGGGDPKSVSNYAKTIPLWVFHGAKDNVVDPNLSINMVSAILNNGGFPKFTLYDFANHNSWDSAFAESELLSWLFSNIK